MNSDYDSLLSNEVEVVPPHVFCLERCCCPPPHDTVQDPQGLQSSHSQHACGLQPLILARVLEDHDISLFKVLYFTLLTSCNELNHCLLSSHHIKNNMQKNLKNKL